MASGYAFAAAQRMMSDGTVSELARLKRIDARARQKLAADCLKGFEIQANEQSYHLWLKLPEHWRSQTFVAAAARRDIALTPSTTFAVTPGHAPNAVRLAFGADDGSARKRSAHAGRDVECQGGRLRLDRITTCHRAANCAKLAAHSWRSDRAHRCIANPQACPAAAIC